MSPLEHISGSSKVILLGLGYLGQLLCSLLGLVVFEIDSAYLLRLVSVLSLPVVSKLSQPLDFVHVFVLLLLKLGHFVTQVINLLPYLIPVV